MIPKKFRPAWRALIFAGLVLAAQAQAPLVEVDYGPPLLTEWVQPEYPAAARKAKTEGRVVVEFVVEADGSVSREKIARSDDELFAAAALAAVHRWKFRPGVEEKAPAAMAMSVPVVFELAQLNRKAPLQPPDELMPVVMRTSPASAMADLDPDYPAELEDRKLPGVVLIQFIVDETGQARSPRVVQASHPAFVETALRTLERAHFEPAHQGPLPKTAKLSYPVEFKSLGAKVTDILEANHLQVLGEQPASLPLPRMLIQPVYPRGRLLAGENGEVEAEFVIRESGGTEQISITSATAPEFGAALTAAIETWFFDPAQNAQGKVPVRMKVTQSFSAEVKAEDARLVGLLQPGGAGVGGAGGLDRKLAPLWRGFPAYPQELMAAQLKGDANVEFIIGRDGRVHLPRVISASEPAFGWAAATAISQWVFEQPMRGGQPVDVTVRIPVGFEPPRR